MWLFKCQSAPTNQPIIINHTYNSATIDAAGAVGRIEQGQQTTRTALAQNAELVAQMRESLAANVATIADNIASLQRRFDALAQKK